MRGTFCYEVMKVAIAFLQKKMFYEDKIFSSLQYEVLKVCST